MIQDGQTFCGMLPQNLKAAAESLYKWSDNKASYGFTAFLPDFSAALQKLLMSAFIVQVQQVCGISITEAEGASARIQIMAARGKRNGFDGPGGVLAWTELPTPGQRSVRQVFDLDEDWLAELILANLSQVVIAYYLVGGHEFLHALGVGHTPNSMPQGNNIMDAFYNSKILGWPQPFGPWDIAELVKRYGQPASVPPPVTPPVPPVVPPASGWTVGMLKDIKVKTPIGEFPLLIS